MYIYHETYRFSKLKWFYPLKKQKKIAKKRKMLWRGGKDMRERHFDTIAGLTSCLRWDMISIIAAAIHLSARMAVRNGDLDGYIEFLSQTLPLIHIHPEARVTKNNKL